MQIFESNVSLAQSGKTNEKEIKKWGGKTAKVPDPGWNPDFLSWIISGWVSVYWSVFNVLKKLSMSTKIKGGHYKAGLMGPNGLRDETSVSTFYFGSTKHRTEHRVLNCSAPGTAPSTGFKKFSVKKLTVGHFFNCFMAKSVI